MILVDTSVLIDFLKGKKNESVLLFDEILEKRIPYGINEFIYQEILQGSKNISEFKKLKEYLETIPFYFLKNAKESYEKAALMSFACRKSSVKTHRTIDFLIVQVAVENNLYFLHNDTNFENIAKVVPELKVYTRRNFR